MVKSKNHTNHNQSRKNHRNGIKRAQKNKYASSKGVHQTLRKNNRRAKRFDPLVKKEKNLTNKIAVRRANKDKIMMAIKARVEKQNLRRLKAREGPKKKAKKIKKKKK